MAFKKQKTGGHTLGNKIARFGKTKEGEGAKKRGGIGLSGWQKKQEKWGTKR